MDRGRVDRLRHHGIEEVGGLSNHGAITLGELQWKLTMLEVACHRCE